MNTLDEEVSKYFDVSPPTNVSGGELPVVSDVFQLQIVEEDGDTQLSLRWTSGNERKVETKLCGGCKTIELNGKLRELVEKLIGGKKVEPVVVERPIVEVEKKPVVVVEKRRKGILFHRFVNGEMVWDETGDEKKDGKYVGEIEKGLPNGKGTVTWSNGSKYVGEWKYGKRNGQGTQTSYLSSVYIGEYVGEWKDGSYHGQGTMSWSDRRKYVGEYKDGKFDGQGTFTSYGGYKYVGEYKDGSYHGQGTLTYSDGRKYVGEFKDRKRNGQGILTTTDGVKMVGEFRDDQPWNVTSYGKDGNIVGKYEYGEHNPWNVTKYDKDGNLILKWVNGVKIIEKKKEGMLFYTRSNGHLGWYETGDEDKDRKYVGQVENGKPHGQGTSTQGGRTMYVGEWKYGYHHGQGTLFVIVIGSEFKVEGIFKNGSPWNCKNYLLNGNYIGKYVNGEWVEEDVEEDNEQKWGVLFHNNWGWFVSGDTDKDGKYLGEIKNGIPNGQGTYTKPDGSNYVGEFKDGKEHGQGTVTSPDGLKYVGGYKDGKKNGQGTGTWFDGSEYVGEYNNGYEHGQGTLTIHDGGKYEGEWKGGKKNGQGTFTYYDGDKYVGEFKDDEPWNGTTYDKNGNIFLKYVNGK